MEKLTPRQSEILAWIKAYLERAGFPPTRVEIANGLGFRSPNAAEDHLKALARKGAIELLAGASRGIRILEENLGLPLVGQVAAGNPILAVENIEAHYALPLSLFQPHADYLLRVRGLSMRDAGILDGDLLAVHRTSEARPGQIVVARVGDDVTVKRFQRQGDTIRLMPENPDFEPIVIEADGDPLAIEGIGVGIIRSGKPL